MSQSTALRHNQSRLELAKRPKFLVSVGATIVACTLGGVAAIVASSQSTSTALTSVTAAPAASSPATTSLATRLPSSAMKDRWFEDAAPVLLTAVPLSAQVRDAWYLDPSTFRTAPPISAQARDSWYRDR
jgi:hypothetical protein